MADYWQLRLLGRFDLKRNQKVVTDIQAAKALALLSYLAVTGQPHSRTALAGLLWGGISEERARGNLRKALSTLRHGLGDHLEITRQSVMFVANNQFWLDVAEFEKQIQSNDVAQLQTAVDLYQGDFLAGFSVRTAPEFENWVLAQQTRLKADLLQALQSLATHFGDQGKVGRKQAIGYIRHLLKLEPWREEAHRQLMLLLAEDGQRGAALNQYVTCRQMLWDEMAVEPSAETNVLYQQLKMQPQPKAEPKKQPFVTTTDYTLVGRKAEWEILKTHWQNLTRPHFICIAGEAGMGKTRLAEELLMLAQQEKQQVARARSHALEGRLAYGPIADWLRTEPLNSTLETLDYVWLTEIARLLPELLIERPNLSQPEPLKDSWQRKRLFEALAQLFTKHQPRLLLVLDDLQWCDSDTLEWLQYVTTIATTPLLIIGTVRADEIGANHPLAHMRRQLQRLDRMTDIALPPLTPAATQALATQVSESNLGNDLAHRIFDDTAGNPLFVIESVRAASNLSSPGSTATNASGANDHTQSIPPKMYGVIQSRLAQLSPEAIKIAEMGATIGRAFDVALLAQATQLDEETVHHHLDELWQRRLIHPVDAGNFDFSHDRIRDVTYAEISLVMRPLLHQKVATALKTRYADNLDAIYGELATHCEYAGLFDQAVACYQQAVKVAQQFYAHREAVNYREHALHILQKHTAETIENTQLIIDLLLALYMDRIAAFGIGAESVGEALAQAHALAQTSGTLNQQADILLALCNYNRTRGRWASSSKWATKALFVARKVGESSQISYAEFLIASAQMRQGNLTQARLQFEQSLQYDAEKTHTRPNYSNAVRFAYCLWLLGFPDQARQRLESIVKLGRKRDRSKLSILPDLPILLHQYALMSAFCGDFSAVDAISAELGALTTKRNDEFSLHWVKIYQGLVAIHQEKLDHGIALIRGNANRLRKLGNYYEECIWRAFLAQAYLLNFEPAAGLSQIDRAFMYVEESGDYHWNAQLLKLKGDCFKMMAYPDTEVETRYQQAIETAQQQKSKSLQLRATVSLARLWQSQGKINQAYHHLSEIYNWFTEGFDTVDLQEAKHTLGELERSIANSEA